MLLDELLPPVKGFVEIFIVKLLGRLPLESTKYNIPENSYTKDWNFIVQSLELA